MQTFFTSHTHFDDEFAIQYFNRPLKRVDEMNCIGLSFDIGVDCTEFTPLSLRQVAEQMGQRRR